MPVVRTQFRWLLLCRARAADLFARADVDVALGSDGPVHKAGAEIQVPANRQEGAVNHTCAAYHYVLSSTNDVVEHVAGRQTGGSDPASATHRDAAGDVDDEDIRCASRQGERLTPAQIDVFYTHHSHRTGAVDCSARVQRRERRRAGLRGMAINTGSDRENAVFSFGQSGLLNGRRELRAGSFWFLPFCFLAGRYGYNRVQTRWTFSKEDKLMALVTFMGPRIRRTRHGQAWGG